MKKKRWWPKNDELCFLITCEELIRKVHWDKTWFSDFLGVYKTKAAAIKMRNKIRALVERELGK